MEKKKIPPPPPASPSLKPLPSTIIHPLVNRKKPKPPPLYRIGIEKTVCPLANPSYPHDLIGVDHAHTRRNCYSCGEQKPLIEDSRFFYYCTTCDVEFHKGCHKFPKKVTHPYHLQHPLTFTFRSYETGIISDGNIDKSFMDAILSESGSGTSHPHKSGSIDKCSWCGKIIECNWFYRCSLCDFCLDLSCCKNIRPPTIPNPKSHHHSLIFYPRPLLTPCDACGTVNVVEPSYACFQCNYMVHQSCISLPRVIKITRHRHRTLFLQPITSPCRICYKTVDGKYGKYSCHEDCSYVAHLKCATHKNVWNGIELKWRSEESYETKDIAPFERVGHDLIKHFSHEHLLRLEKYDGVRDAEKQCQACVLPINSRDFYNCMQCAFFLHEVCAGLLRRLDHALHIHTLVLDPSHAECLNSCSVCTRKFSGFRYKCPGRDCVVSNGFQIDVRCASVVDPFKNKCHEHPLFISTSAYDKGKSMICCRGCKEVCMESYIQCTICEFAMCYKCTTIQDEVNYKYDKHPLSLFYGEKADGMYRCEVCEKELNPTEWFYTCNECCVTVHLQCIFGSSIYMKHGFIFKSKTEYMSYFISSKVKVIQNSNSSRPFCDICNRYCPSSVYYLSDVVLHAYFHFPDPDPRYVILSCSLKCLEETRTKFNRTGPRPWRLVLENGDTL